MTAEGYNLVGVWQSLPRDWHEFFHRPRDTRVCAAIRIGLAMLVLVHLAVLYPDLDRWFTDDGVMTTAASRELALPYQWSILWLLPATAAIVHACFWAAAVQAALLLVGLLSRANAACLLVWLISFQSRNALICDGEDTVMRLLALYLVLMPCGASWSLDALIMRWWQARHEKATLPLRQHDGPGWGLRLLQIQMAVVFFSAGLHKLGADQWLDGTAMFYVARLDDYFGRFPVPAWLFDSPWSVAVITWTVVLGELLVPFFIWFRQTRRWALAAAVLFHLGNEWTMHLFLFHWLMLVGWLAFVEPSDFAWIGRVKSLLGPGSAGASPSRVSPSRVPTPDS